LIVTVLPSGGNFNCRYAGVLIVANQKLLLEGEGILAWAVLGAQRWHKEGLTKPEEVEAAGMEWQSDMDQIGRFISERCATGPSCASPSSHLYAAYKHWAEQEGEEIVSQKTFASKLLDRDGFTSTHSRSGTQYSGIGLR